MEGKDGTIEPLPEPLAGGYKTLKEQGLTIEANDLLVPLAIGGYPICLIMI
jgi:hypothetical protein